MEERGLVGIEARTEDGDEIGRISEVLTDENTGEVTHVVAERGDQRFEIPISAISLDPEADFATFHADRSDEEPGDHAGDEIEPAGYAPAESDVDDYRHEGQFVSEPNDPTEARPLEDLDRESGEASGWEDEGSNTPESGYPRNDAYIDPDTGEEEVDPLMADNYTLQDDVEDLISETDLRVRSLNEGVVELTGAAATREDLEESVEEIMGLDGVREVDTTDVDVG
ncbi:MAG: PRC-barrel domain-containing protein [Actinomycetota bacterium]|nr:PRC-barrel domain-containing protein [Actinomycetota bacterium]